MAIVYDLFRAGGLTMYPLLFLSVGTIACALERSAFWFQLLTKENLIVRDVLAAARFDLDKALAIAYEAKYLPIGRFLLAPLKLSNPTPETFRLAMEAAGDKEFIKMRRGDKLLETVVALAPLLGLLGTVTGLIATFSNLTVGGGNVSQGATKAAEGIGEALISTATGMIVAIVALIILQVLVSLQSKQVDYFAEVGSELELIYRQTWWDRHNPQDGRQLTLKL